MGKKKILPSKVFVTCVDCGRRFNKNRLFGVHYEHHGARNRYICPKCYKKRKSEQKFAQNERDKQIHLSAAKGTISEDEAIVLTHKTSKTKLIWGGILTASGLIGLFSSNKESSYIITCILLMIVGGFLLYLYFKSQKSYNDALANEAKRTIKINKLENNATKICPQCGAVTKGQFCEYCGAKLLK